MEMRARARPTVEAVRELNYSSTRIAYLTSASYRDTNKKPRFLVLGQPGWGEQACAAALTVGLIFW